jgi:hypothetical protein
MSGAAFDAEDMLLAVNIHAHGAQDVMRSKALAVNVDHQAPRSRCREA